MRNLILIIILYLSLFSLNLFAQESRKELNFPDIDGYKVVKCDFHLHTVFSDGLVWPTVRVTEAWSEGLDLICISDHLEYRPFKKNIDGDYNKSFEIAKKEADKYGIICVNACEITKKLPTGHFNAIFTKDNNKIINDDIILSIQEAKSQGAFVSWNHPGWQQKENIPVWFQEHSEIFQKGLMNGIEVVNDIYYAPLAFQWAIDSNITIISGSDLHDPAHMMYERTSANHRPITLVLAKDKTENDVKNALFEKRTMIWYKDYIFGKTEFIEELFKNSISIQLPNDSLLKKSSFYIKIKNNSSFDFKINRNSESADFILDNDYTVFSNSTSIIRVKNVNKADKKTIEIPIEIANLLSSPENNLKTKLKVR